MGKYLEIPTEADPTGDELIRMTEPCKAASKRNWRDFIDFFERNPEALFYRFSISGDTAFHFAASTENLELLRDLLGMVQHSKIIFALTEMKDDHGNTVLHEVATTDCVDAAKFLVNKISSSFDGTRAEMEEHNSRQLGQRLKVKNRLGETPLYRAAALGKTKMVQYLAQQIQKVSGNIHDHFYRYDPISVLHIAILGQHFETAFWLLKKGKELGKVKEMNGLTCLHLLALTPSGFLSTSSKGILKKLVYCCLPKLPEDEDDDNDCLDTDKNSYGLQRSNNQTAISRMHLAIWRCLTKGWPIMEKIWEEKRQHQFAIKLLKLLVKQDTSWIKSHKADDTTISIGLGRGGKTDEKIKATPSNRSSSSPETPLLMAARTGIIEIVNEILNEYPEAVEHVSENEQNILHVVIMNRHDKIFKLIKKKVISIERLASAIDSEGYTILHHAADMTFYHGTRHGPAFQLQDELEWFQRVEKIMPSHYVMHRDKNSMTAEELFDEQHKEQLDMAKKWIKDISGSCSTVAVLVASVAFAAAYTAPGGSNKKGLPILLHSSLFMLFAIMDVASLASSFTSVVMFLSIINSPFELKDFLYPLPQKMTIGFSFLFLSVITTMITFTATLLLILRNLNRHWTAALILSAAFIPVLVFALMQFRLYVELVGDSIEFLKEVMQTLSWKSENKKKRN